MDNLPRADVDVYADAVKRAEMLTGVQKWDAALTEIRRALAAQPDSAHAHYVAGLCHYMLSQYPQAKSEAKESIKYDPELPHAYWLLAVTCERQERYGEGLHAINQAIELDSTDSDNHGARALILFNSGKIELALESAEHALRLNPENIESKQIRTLALSSLGRHTEAEQEALESLRLGADESISWYQRAVQLFAQGKIDEARAASLEALRIDPEHEEAQTMLMQTIGARNAFFGLFWRWTIFMYRFPPQTRWIIIGAIYVFIRILKSSAKQIPSLQPFAITILLLYIIFCIYTWAARPLFRLAVRRGWFK